MLREEILWNLLRKEGDRLMYRIEQYGNYCLGNKITESKEKIKISEENLNAEKRLLSVLLFLALHAKPGPGNSIEPNFGNGLTTILANAIGLFFYP